MNTESTQEGAAVNTTLLMTASALFMGILGLSAALFPGKLVRYLGGQQQAGILLMMNVLGILYLGFAVVNWMAREVLIGGIYGRPLTLGNFVHFFGATIALVKYAVDIPNAVTVIALTLAYALFATGFGYVAFAGGETCG